MPSWQKYPTTTRAVNEAIVEGSDNPLKLLATAVVISAYVNDDDVDELWLDIADIDPEVYGVKVTKNWLTWRDVGLLGA